MRADLERDRLVVGVTSLTSPQGLPVPVPEVLGSGIISLKVRLYIRESTQVDSQSVSFRLDTRMSWEPDVIVTGTETARLTGELPDIFRTREGALVWLEVEKL
jgi:hypothetical protein